jgi:hypothetical protein
MMKLNKDVLFLIAENLQDDMTSLYSCLLVDRSWCEAMVSILWKIPGRMILTKEAEDKLFNVILLHLSKESRDNLKKQEIDLFKENYRTTSFNYINFWRHLDLHLLEIMISRNLRNLKKSKISMIKNELLKLFVNKNTKFISLHIPGEFNYGIHNISWAEQCFSDLKYLSCYDEIHQNILEELSIISKSIKKLSCNISENYNNISGIDRLIEAQENLTDIQISCYNDEALLNIEELLIRNAVTVQYLRIYWEPYAKFLSHFVNLKVLEMETPFLFRRKKMHHLEKTTSLYHLKKTSLPALKILKANLSQNIILIRLIESANIQLTAISIRYDRFSEINDIRMLIQTIYQNCRILRYIKVPIKDEILTEFERLLVSSQYLNGLVIDNEIGFNYKSIFEILIRSSPSNLFKFKFVFEGMKLRLKLKSLESFLDNWKDRQPMLLQISLVNFIDENQWNMKRLNSIIEKYKAKGIIKKFDLSWLSRFEDFEWVQDVSHFYFLQ